MIYIATKNSGKFKEITDFLQRHQPDLQFQQLPSDLPEAPETGFSFAENAKQKAKYYGDLLKLPVLADDSGLEIEALGGLPGIISSRFAESFGGYQNCFKFLEHILSGKSPRANFSCAISYYDPSSGLEVSALGQVFGALRFPGQGPSGFGFDPIFVPEGESHSFGEMSSSEKAKYSHRSRALEEFLKQFI